MSWLSLRFRLMENIGGVIRVWDLDLSLIFGLELSFSVKIRRIQLLKTGLV